MNVILLQDIDNLGPMGTQVKVKDGYARNYLLPKKLAVEATPGAQKELEKRKKERKAVEDRLKAEASQVCERLKNFSLNITADNLFAYLTDIYF